MSNTAIDVQTGLLGYGDIEKAALLAVYSKEHLLILGEPGTAKSLFARKFFAHFAGTMFETQLSKFSDESAIFGLPNMKKLREEGEVEYPERGIAAAEWAFLDEIFDSSDVLLRALLSILNERKQMRGNVPRNIPLQTCIATANYSRHNEITAAVTDRFQLTVTAPRPSSSQRTQFYDGVRFEEITAPASPITLSQINAVRQASLSVTIKPALVSALIQWSDEQQFTPRRERKMAKLLKVSAAMRGANTVGLEDMANLKFMLPLTVTPASVDMAYGAMVEKIKVAEFEQGQMDEVKKLAATKLPAAADIARLKAIAGVIKKLGAIQPVSQTVSAHLETQKNTFRQAHQKLAESLGLLI